MPDSTKGFDRSSANIWKLLGITILTFALMPIAFHTFSAAVYSQQALTAFDSSSAPSASFVADRAADYQVQSTHLAMLNQGLPGLIKAASMATSKSLTDKIALYNDKSAFKTDVIPILIRHHLSSKVRTGLEFGDVEFDYYLWLDGCPNGPKSNDCGGNLPISPTDLWSHVLDEQRTLTIDSSDADDKQRAVNVAQTELTTAGTAFSNLAGNKNDTQRNIITLWPSYSNCAPMPSLLCINATSPIHALLPLLAMLMGAVGGLVLSWIDIVEEGASSNAMTVFANPLIGAVVGALGYFLLLVGAGLFAVGLGTGLSAADPKIVVALSLLLGLGGSSTLAAFRTVGASVRARLTRMSGQGG